MRLAVVVVMLLFVAVPAHASPVIVDMVWSTTVAGPGTFSGELGFIDSSTGGASSLWLYLDPPALTDLRLSIGGADRVVAPGAAGFGLITLADFGEPIRIEGSTTLGPGHYSFRFGLGVFEPDVPPLESWGFLLPMTLLVDDGLPRIDDRAHYTLMPVPGGLQSSVPYPASLLLIGLGAVLLWVWRRRTTPSPRS